MVLLQQRLRRYENVRDAVCTLVSSLKACSRSRNLEAGRKVHHTAIQSGLHKNVYVATTLVNMYSKCRSMSDARTVFDSTFERNTVSWNALLLGYVENGESQMALDLFQVMKLQSQPNVRTYCIVVMACSSLATNEAGTVINGKVVKLKSLGRGMQLHSEATEKHGVDTFTATALVDMYVKCGSLADAHRVFEELPCRELPTWNAMMLGYATQGEGEKALQLFNRLKAEGHAPDARSCLAALMACASLAEKEEGLVKLACLETGMSIHSQATQMGLDDMLLANTLIDMYAKCGSVLDARVAFDKMPHRDVVAWTAMIMGYADNGESEQALTLYTLIDTQELMPNARLFVAALSACGGMVALEAGKALHARICQSGLESSELLANSLVDLYGKCGSMVEAQHVFYSLDTKDIATWNALLSGYSRQGDWVGVFELFWKMREVGLPADSVTSLSVLTACSHAGLVGKGKDYFQSIRSRNAQHYHCMVDMLARANHLEEAVSLVKNMPFKSTAVAWRSVLGACRKWRNVHVARLAFESLVAMDKDLSLSYVLMGNIYAS